MAFCTIESILSGIASVDADNYLLVTIVQTILANCNLEEVNEWLRLMTGEDPCPALAQGSLFRALEKAFG